MQRSLLSTFSLPGTVRWLLVGLLIGGGLAPRALAQFAVPSGDAFVTSGTPNTNYGTSRTLRVRGAGSSPAGIYLRFDLSTITSPGQLLDAELRLVRSGSCTPGMPLDVRLSDDTAWNEGTLTFANQPGPVGGILASETAPAVDETPVSFQIPLSLITDARTTDNIISFYVDTPDAGISECRFGSRENRGSRRPRLTLIIGNAEVVISGDAGWRMLSSPTSVITQGLLAQQNLIQGVPDQYPTYPSPNLFFWDVNTQTFVAPTGGDSQVFDDGRGFIWYFFNNDLDPGGFFGGGSSTSKSLPFTLSAPGSDGADTAFVALGPGFNLIGNPLTQGIRLNRVDILGGTLVSNIAQVWQDGAGEPAPGAAFGTTGTYVDVPFAGGEVSVWQGFFVENDDATTLAFPPRAKTGTVPFIREAPPSQIAFELRGTSETARVRTLDKAITLALSDDAGHGWDVLDASKLRPLDHRFGTLAFVGDRNGQARLKAQDSRPLSLVRPVSIPMQFDASVRGTFELTWNMQAVPAGWSVSLRDNATGRTVDLRQNSLYRFDANPTEAMAERRTAGIPMPSVQAMAVASQNARFTLTLTPNAAMAEVARKATHFLGSAYPNPFNPETQFTLSVPQTQTVQIEVFNTLGQRVALLHNGPMSADQTMTFRFDGAQMPSGLYFVRATGEHFTATQRLTLLK